MFELNASGKAFCMAFVIQGDICYHIDCYVIDIDDQIRIMADEIGEIKRPCLATELMSTTQFLMHFAN